MPIYEFKCVKCQEYIELLVMGSHDKDVEMKCNKCGSEDLERILSSSNINMAPGGGSTQRIQSSTQDHTYFEG